MYNLAGRNIKLFFRDRTSVFFSLLSVLIIIGLYILFLGDMMVSEVNELGEDSRFLMDSWIMSGVLAVTSITTTMGVFGIMVEDRSKKLIKDFSASPLKRSSLAGGYVISAVAIGIIMSIITFILAELYILVYGGSLLPLEAMLKVLGFIILSVISSSSMVFFVVSFFKSSNAFATAGTIIGTLIGFVTGIYIPIGTLPEAVQWVVKLFPVSHSGALFRQVMMEQPLATTFANIPAETLSEFKLSMGVYYKYGDYTAGSWLNITVLLVTTAVFFLLTIYKLSKKTK